MAQAASGAKAEPVKVAASDTARKGKAAAAEEVAVALQYFFM
jgi:hypothetical protein